MISRDAIGAGNYSIDIDNQPNDNYTYDAIGNLTADTQEGISNINWSVYGKITDISKSKGNYLSYRYDASGNRVVKSFQSTSGGPVNTTFYVRDAQGNTIATYSKASDNSPIILDEQYLYGSSRLGMWKPKLNLNTATSGDVSTKWQQDGLKSYELTKLIDRLTVLICYPILIEG